MGAKKKNNNNNGDGGEQKKDDNPITVVLKIDMHCEGCASKIVKTVRALDGVDAAKAEFGANKLTVIGKVDPSKLRESLAEMMKKKVDLISPQPKKQEGNDNNNNKNDNSNKKKTDGNDEKKKPDEKKPKEKEPPVTTAVFKLRLHCQGCIEKIHKTVTKTKGYNDMSIDKQKDLVTVIGSMDMKALSESLAKKLKRTVEIVPPKKEKDGEKGENGGGGKKKGGGGGDGGQKGDGGDGGGGKMEESRMEYMGQPVYGFGIGYVPGFGYPPGYAGEYLHAPQMFSDENPNACSVM